MTEVGTTGITAAILGMYKNVFGDVRAIDETGRIYSINTTTGQFTLLSTVAGLNSQNADGASGCYDPPSISGHLYVDANGLTDNLVSGVGTNVLGGVTMYANLIQGGKVVKSTAINGDGFYEFLGLFSGSYEVQISSILGTAAANPPNQNLPSSYAFVGDHIGAGVGSDGSPNGIVTVTIPVGGGNVTEVNIGVDARPVAQNVTAPIELNPGTTIRAATPILNITDIEDGIPTTVIINQTTNKVTEGTLYYNNIEVTNNQVITNFQNNLLTFDPIDGEVTADFIYSTQDAAGIISGTATAVMEFTSSLPIELIYFEGKAVDNTVVLEWSTASETNSSYYIVQRSTTGELFEDLERVDAAGNSVEELIYEVTDQSPKRFFYYRLMAIDQDESFTYSNTVYIAHNQEYGISIYPTVVTDNLTIRYEEQEDHNWKIEIYDVMGRVVRSTAFSEDEKVVSLQDLTAGTYTVRIISKTGEKILSKKIVKQ